ncbi:MAG: protein-L-isoaspartate(D-aspartate) O-methyltransferase [Candidatus Competibacteraceae bacterium]|nr:protein-L-isoaspartate(D-aspartate) O-methyltransferase [Candidatus Competibacteraceae bacterium]MBK7983640.1 protein-L-isoaspartate(D-aspartate) O-methyltransferase [Candidatus Competibacteraceae bacterium]MBK8897820.1 protein-L-isoaspartate(D-aspartate) O-methyltransferase [Candidatus Competibacteraceae bacterium]MBK8961623.1 protein-L-isoaspartate(D-aspartate) O-methyltransferase [Candidatus Competibacteraceae bacterium]MBK9950845.1 protein-L-isoaspartate(D-aspartate) O-methyltransferase 
MSDEPFPDPESARRLLERVAAEMRETSHLTGCSQLSDAVRRALAEVPRHRFVAADQLELAYADRPLPIGRGQTISQPFIVALMTELLRVDPQAVVLEIGTGSGYQTAVLAQLARQVYSVERIPELAETAGRRLYELGYDNIEIRCDDGGRGWKEQAPFDGIMVTAAATEVPPALVRQLKPGGRLVIPVGEPYRSQDLRVISKDQQGKVATRSALRVVFVPLVRDRA